MPPWKTQRMRPRASAARRRPRTQPACAGFAGPAPPRQAHDPNPQLRCTWRPDRPRVPAPAPAAGDASRDIRAPSRTADPPADRDAFAARRGLAPRRRADVLGRAALYTFRG